MSWSQRSFRPDILSPTTSGMIMDFGNVSVDPVSDIYDENSPSGPGRSPFRPKTLSFGFEPAADEQGENKYAPRLQRMKHKKKARTPLSNISYNHNQSNNSNNSNNNNNMHKGLSVPNKEVSLFQKVTGQAFSVETNTRSLQQPTQQSVSPMEEDEDMLNAHTQPAPDLDYDAPTGFSLSQPLSSRHLNFGDDFQDTDDENEDLLLNIESCPTPLDSFPSFQRSGYTKKRSSSSRQVSRSVSGGFGFTNTELEELKHRSVDTHTAVTINISTSSSHQISQQDLFNNTPLLLQSQHEPDIDTVRKHKRSRSSLTQSSPFMSNADRLPVLEQPEMEDSLLPSAETELFRVNTDPPARLCAEVDMGLLPDILENVPHTLDDMYDTEYLLPLCEHDHTDNTNRISTETVCKLIEGGYKDIIQKFIIIDCRYDYEYKGGHIKGAVNIHDPNLIRKFFKANKDLDCNIAVIFHCEYSQHRGPASFKFMRKLDRQYNPYPRLSFADMYVMNGGYREFYKEAEQHCVGLDESLFVSMWDKRYTKELKICHNVSWCSRRSAKRKKAASRPRFKSATSNHSPPSKFSLG